MITVVVVDDQPLVRAGLRTLIEVEEGIELVGEAADGEQALHLARTLRPDVVLMDIRMPNRDGLSALAAITDEPELATVRVIMLTVFDHDDYLFEALRSGASGFLLKDAEPGDLVQAIRVAADGEALLSPSLTRRLIEQFVSRQPQASAPDLRGLTEREREILAWVATGRSNHEIAEALVISPATVRTHVGRAMTKLHARDRTQLALHGVRAGLTLPGEHHTG